MSKFKRILGILGSGFVTRDADDDLSGMGTYSLTGAQFGYSQLWLTLFSFAHCKRNVAGRISLVNGKGLSRLIKKHYPPPLLYGLIFILLSTNIINIGADLGAIVESASLLLGLPQ